jgi:NADH dehydrogenase/NADH:ubiquinone oxidoreductase subunit G
MRIVELIIDEKDETSGIDAVSVVESPAIESDFIALKKHEIELKEIDAEKRILMGAALIPNKQIYRKNDKNEEYYIYFSEETVRKASELFFMNSNQNNATLEHKQKLEGMSVVESWIVEGAHDKSMNYGFNFPKGTWVISMKVNNDEIWNKVKLGEVKGFSIEGYFADKYEMSLINEDDLLITEIKNLILSEEKTNLETYNDYPEQAKENAKIALRYAEENGWGDCGTPVGKARANQLANGENISEDTIARMASFERQRENSQRELGDGCGRLMWLAWGGDAGVEWASRKLKQIRKEELAEGQTHYTIDGKIYEGETHKDANGNLMTGKVHTEDSKFLYHAI